MAVVPPSRRPRSHRRGRSPGAYGRRRRRAHCGREADEACGLLDAEVRLLRRDHDSSRPERPRCCERRDRRRRRRVLDVPVPAARQAEQLREPVQHRHLELGHRRRRGPRNPFTFSVAISSSARTPGSEPVFANQAKNRGWFHCVSPGRSVRRDHATSPRRALPARAASREAWRAPRRARPRRDRQITERCRYSSAHSAARSRSARKVTVSSSASRSAPTCACSARLPW